MKKLLSILAVMGLSASISTNIVACGAPDESAEAVELTDLSDTGAYGVADLNVIVHYLNLRFAEVPAGSSYNDVIDLIVNDDLIKTYVDQVKQDTNITLTVGLTEKILNPSVILTEGPTYLNLKITTDEEGYADLYDIVQIDFAVALPQLVLPPAVTATEVVQVLKNHEINLINDKKYVNMFIVGVTPTTIIEKLQTEVLDGEIADNLKNLVIEADDKISELGASDRGQEILFTVQVIDEFDNCTTDRGSIMVWIKDITEAIDAY